MRASFRHFRAAGAFGATALAYTMRAHDTAARSQLGWIKRRSTGRPPFLLRRVKTAR
jgi:hypothetical protein